MKMWVINLTLSNDVLYNYYWDNHKTMNNQINLYLFFCQKINIHTTTVIFHKNYQQITI
jgi:hypothetical protein